MTQSQTIKYANKGNLREGSLTKHLVRLTLPMVWGIAIIISFQLVDMFFIARLGLDALAAISFTFPLTYAIFAMSIGFGIAMSSVVSRLLGEGNTEKVAQVVTHGLVLVSLLLLGVSALGIIFHDAIFGAMGAKGKFLDLIRDYMHIWFASAILISIPLVGNSAIRAAGDAFSPAIIMTIAAVINIILDPILIFGLFGFPRLEIQGAAIATVIANFVALVAGLYLLACKKKFLQKRWLTNFTGFGESAKRLLTIAIPVGIAQAIGPFVNAIITALLAGFGAKAVAAFGVVNRVEAFAFIVIMALSSGMAPVIGQNFGAEKYDRVKEALRLCIKFSVFWSLGVALILYVFGRHIAAIFVQDEAVISIVVTFFTIVPITYVFRNLIYGWSSAFNAMGQPKKSFMIIVIEMLIFMLPAVYIGAQYGIAGIFIAMAVVHFVTGLGTHIWARYNCNKACS